MEFIYYIITTTHTRKKSLEEIKILTAVWEGENAGNFSLAIYVLMFLCLSRDNGLWFLVMDYSGRDTTTSGSAQRTCSMRPIFFLWQKESMEIWKLSVLWGLKEDKRQLREGKPIKLPFLFLFGVFVCFNHKQKKKKKNWFEIVTTPDYLIYLFSSSPLLLQNIFFVKISNTSC